MNKLLFLTLLSAIYQCYAFSGGAPELVCDDMMPVHLVPSQNSKLPYKVSFSNNKVKGGETVDIEFGEEKFKGLMVEVRKGQKSRGTFIFDEDENDFKGLTCHGFKNSAATHQNNANKKNKKLIWRAPKEPGKYTVYVTIAKDGFVFWTKIPIDEITVV